MTDEIEIVVSMRAIGKGRPRFSKIGGLMRTYTPTQTRSAEKILAMAANRAMVKRKMIGQGIPIRATIEAQYEPPKGWSKKKREMALRLKSPKVGKPDCDNIEKLVFDSLNGIVFYDDSQLVSTSVRKFYGETDSIRILISEVK